MTINGNVNLNSNNVVGTDYLVSGLCWGSTNLSGNYSCSGASQNTNYTVTMTNYETASCGLDINDVYLIQYYIIGTETPGIDYLVSCDVNDNGSVTATDAYLVANFALNNNPWGYNQVRFVSQDHIDEVNNCSQCDYLEEWSGETINTGTSSSVTVDFTMYQLGDVDDTKKCTDYVRSSSSKSYSQYPYNITVISENKFIIRFDKLEYYCAYFKFDLIENSITDAFLLNSPESSTVFNDHEIITIGKEVIPLESKGKSFEYIITTDRPFKDGEFNKMVSRSHIELFNPKLKKRYKLTKSPEDIKMKITQNITELSIECNRHIEAKIYLRSLNGSLIINDNMSGNHHNLNINQLSKGGIYLLTIQGDDYLESKKIFIFK